MNVSVSLRRAALIATFLVMATACGASGPSVEATTAAGLELPFREQPTSDPAPAARAITDVGFQLFKAERGRSPDANLSLSPTSLVVALSMMEPGAVNDGQTELRGLLGIDDPDAYHAAMNALEQSLEGRRANQQAPSDMIRLANAAYLQPGYPFKQPYLDTVGRHYGAALHQVDFGANPDGAAEVINAWVAEETEDHIPTLIPAGGLTADTVMVLVNALYTKADWALPFPDDDTETDSFTLLDGSTVDVPMMAGEAALAMKADGWVGASKPLMGDLHLQVIVPTDGRFDEVGQRIDEVFARFEQGAEMGGDFWLPRFKTRTKSKPAASLQELGVVGVFKEGRLLGVADSERLILFDIWHEVYLDVNETGIEAAAATALGFRDVGGYVGPPPVAVRVDRPFYYRIHDGETGATLFIGQIVDPTIGAGS